MHSMWVLSGLLAFVRLQHFAPEDSNLFNTLVTSLLKSLAHQVSLSASHNVFIALKCRQFYLLHLPAYFSDINKHAMLSSPAVCAEYLFNEADVSLLLSDTQTSSSHRLWWMWPCAVLALVLGVLVLGVLLLAVLLLGVVTGTRVLLLVPVCMFVSTPLPLHPLLRVPGRVFGNRVHVLRPA